MAQEGKISSAIVLDGEREYKAACRDITTNLKLVASEMKVVSAEYGANTQSIQGLTAKQDALKKKFEEHEKLVSAGAKALQDMRENGIEPTDPAYKKMETAMNNAKAEMIKTQKEIDETGAELEDAEKSADGFGEEIKKTGDETEAAGNRFAGIGQTVGAVGRAFGTALAALGTAALGAATGLAKLTVDAANFADDLMTQATYTRQSTDDLQKYAYACRFIDTDMDTLTKTMAKNVKSMETASSGTGAMAEAYGTLGVSVTNADGSLRDSNEVYWETIDALGQVTNETERDALAMQVFGKSAQELNSVIGAGSEAFKALGDEAVAMGAVMGSDALSSLGDFRDKIDMMEASMDGLKNAASLIALPFLDTMLNEGLPILGEFTKGIQDANGDMEKMGDAVGTGVSAAAALLVEKLPEFVGMGTSMLTSLVGGLVDNADTIATSAGTIITTLITGLTDLLPTVLEGAATIITELATGLGNALPELIPKAVEAITTIATTLVDNLPTLVTAATDIIVGLAGGLVDALPQLVEKVPELIQGLFDAIIAAVPLLLSAGASIVSMIAQGLGDVFPIFKPITNAIQFLADKLGGIAAAFTKNTQEQKALKESTDALIDSNNNLTKSIEDNSRAYEEKAKGIVENAAVSSRLADEVYALAAAEGKTTAEKAKLAALVEQLNATMPELNLAYDQEADALSKTADHTYGLINAKKEEARQQAARERAVELAKEQMQAEEQLAEVTKLRIELEEQKAAGMSRNIFGVYTMQGQLDELIRQEEALTSQIEFQEMALDNVTNTMVESSRLQAEAMEKVTTAAEDQTVALEGQAEAAESNAERVKTAAEIQTEIAAQRKAKDDELTAAMIENANAMGLTLDEYKNHMAEVEAEEAAIMKKREDTLNKYTELALDMFNKIETKSQVSVSQMSANLEHNQAVITKWGDNILSLEGKIDQGLLDKLREAGPESAATVQALANATEKELARLNAAWATGGEVAQNALLNTWGVAGKDAAENLGDGFDEGMTDSEQLMTGAVQSAGDAAALSAVTAVNQGILNNIDQMDGSIQAIVDGVTTGLTGKSEELAQIGTSMVGSISTGATSGATELAGKAPEIVQALITAFIAEHQKLQSEGVDMDKSVADGMVSGISDITAKIPQIMTAITTSITGFKSSFIDAGEDAMRGLWRGFENMRSWLESNVKNLMWGLVGIVKSEMQIYSPSRVFAGLGRDMARGQGVGFVEEMRNVGKQIRQATNDAVPTVPTPRGPRRGAGGQGAGGVSVVQNIYTSETNYAAQQREAAKQFKLIAREVYA